MNQKSNVDTNKKVAVLVVVLLVLANILYFSNFSGRLAKEDSKWANYATFITLFVSIGNLVIFYFLSLEIHRYNKKRDLEDERLTINLNRPILSFSRLNHNYYSVKNVGAGPAINVIIKSHLVNKKWDYARIFYSLSKEELVPLIWTTHCNRLMAKYEDSFGNKYFSYINNDKLTVITIGFNDSLEKNREIMEELNLPSAELTWA